MPRTCMFSSSKASCLVQGAKTDPHSALCLSVEINLNSTAQLKQSLYDLNRAQGLASVPRRVGETLSKGVGAI